MLRNASYILFIVLLLFILALGVLTYFIHRTSFQNYLAQKVVSYLEEKLNTDVRLGHIEVDFFNNARMDNLLIMDLDGDTLLYSHHLNATIDVFSFFNETLQINTISLDGSSFHLKKYLDNTTNIDFVLAAFKSKNEKKEKKKLTWQLDCNQIQLKDIHFRYTYDKGPYDMIATLGTGSIPIHRFVIDSLAFEFGKISLDKITYHYVQHIKTTNTLSQFDKKNTATLDTIISPKLPLKFNIEEIAITESQFAYSNENKTPITAPYFDPNYIHFTTINGTLKNVFNNADSIFAHLDNINIIDKNNFEIKELSADYKFSFDQMRFDNLTLRTTNSNLRDQFAMQYSSFDDFSDFINKVYLTSNIINASIDWKDIAYFSPAIKTTPILHDISDDKMQINGKCSGYIARLKIKDANILAGNHTSIKADVSLNGLPDINETFMEIKAEQITTSAADLKNMLPSVKFPKQIDALGIVNFRGNFTGFTKDFVADGILTTNIGSFKSDINMKFNQNYSDARYKGFLQANDLDLGKLSGRDSLLGKTTFNIALDGQGLNIDDLQSKINGNITSLDFKGHTYTDVKVDGLLSEKTFTGQLESKDPSLALNFEGSVDFKTNNPTYDFKANVIHANLQKMGITDAPISITSKMDLDIEGKHIDSILGNAKFKDILLTVDKKTYALDELIIDSRKRGNNQTVFLHSNLFDASFQGNFLLSDLPPAINELLVKYFPSQSFTKKTSKYHNLIDFDIKIYDSEKITELFIPDLHEVKNAKIHGRYDSGNKSYTIEGSIPRFYYKNIRFDSLILFSSAKDDHIALQSNLSKIKINEDFFVPSPRFVAEVYQDSTHFNIKTGNDKDSTRIHINGLAQATKENIKIRILPSDIIINNQSWITDHNNLITIKGSKVNLENLKLFHDNSYIVANTIDEDWKNIKLDMHEIPIQDFIALVHNNKYDMHGVINGTFDLQNVYEGPLYMSDFKIPMFTLGEDTIGTITMNASMASSKDKINIHGSIYGNRNNVNINGTYNLKNHTEALNINVKAKEVWMVNLNKFTKGIFSNLQGIAAGDIHIGGSVSDIALDGNVFIRDGGVTVDYLNTHYKLDNENIRIKKYSFDFETVTLYDEYKNEALLTGKIVHHNFRNWNFNLNIDTKNFHALNTTKKDNSLFYGQAFTDGAIHIYGPLDQMIFDITAKSNKGTYLSIPISDETDVQQTSFIHFINTGKDSIDNTYKRSLNGIKLNFNLDVTDEATIRIILDETAGDIIESEGNGNILMNITTLGDFEMRGAYEISQGDYLFTLQNIINKRFEIQKGSSITWTGSPYDAQLDVTAIYATRPSVKELLETTGIPGASELSAAKSRLPVHLNLILQGALFNPEVKLDYEFVDANNSIEQLGLESVSNAIKRDPNELNRQVFGLMVLNRFLPLQSGAESSGLIANSGTNTLNEFFSNQLSNYLSDFISKYITDIDLSFDYRNENSTNNPNQQLVLAMRKKMFKDRVEVSIGGNFDFNSSTEEVGNNNIAGDFAITYAVTNNGRVLIKAFRKTENDVFRERNLTRNGVSIFYREEFDTLKELFERTEKTNQKKKKKKTKDILSAYQHPSSLQYHYPD